MDLSKKLLTLLAIFCVIASAGVVCAEDNGDLIGMDNTGGQDGWAGSQYNDTEGGWAGSQYNDTEGGWAGSQYQDDGGWAGSQYNETLENAAGAPVNDTVQNANVAQNSTANATAPHNMLATGNPILLVAVAAVLGGAALVTRKK